MNSHSISNAKKISNSNIHLQENVDFRKYPDKDQLTCDTDSQITINHIYGDAVYLLYALVRHGVLSMTLHDYEKIIQICDIPIENLSKENLDKFYEILNKAVVNSSALLRFMGDELTKNNDNDPNKNFTESSHTFFIMKILERLGSNSRKKVEYNIMLSDSNMQLIQYTESECPFLKSPKKVKRRSSMMTQIPLFYINDKASSLTVPREYLHTNNQLSIEIQSLQYFVDRDYITTEDMLYLVNQYYKDHIKLLDYSFNPETHEISIYSHNLLNLSAINSLAITLHSESTNINPLLTSLIDVSNFKFKTHIIFEDFTKELHEFTEKFKMVDHAFHQQEQMPANITFISSKKTNIYDEVKHYNVYYSHDLKSIPVNKNKTNTHASHEFTKKNVNALKSIMVLIRLNPNVFNLNNIDLITDNLTDIQNLSSALLKFSRQGIISLDNFNSIMILNEAKLLNNDNLDLLKNVDHQSAIGKFLKICTSVNCPIDQEKFNLIEANPSFIKNTSARLEKIKIEGTVDKNAFKAELEAQFNLSLTTKSEVVKLTDNPSSFFDANTDNYLSTLIHEAVQHPIPKSKLKTLNNQ